MSVEPTESPTFTSLALRVGGNGVRELGQVDADRDEHDAHDEGGSAEGDGKRPGVRDGAVAGCEGEREAAEEEEDLERDPPCPVVGRAGVGASTPPRLARRGRCLRQPPPSRFSHASGKRNEGKHACEAGSRPDVAASDSQPT